MQTLDLSRNRFFGSLPAEITMLQDLRYLFLNSNRFAGKQTKTKKKTQRRPNPNPKLRFFFVAETLTLIYGSLPANETAFFRFQTLTLIYGNLPANETAFFGFQTLTLIYGSIPANETAFFEVLNPNPNLWQRPCQRNSILLGAKP
jgi:hypothetical protein